MYLPQGHWMNYRLYKCIGHDTGAKLCVIINPKVKVKKTGYMQFSLPEVSFCYPSLLTNFCDMFIFLKQNAPPKIGYQNYQ